MDNNKIPENIVDEDAYLEWVKLSEAPILTTTRHQKVSDGRSIDLGTMQHNLIEKICELPEPEQRKILMLKKAYQKALNKANTAKRRAFGLLKDGVPFNSRTILDNREADLVDLFGRMFTIKEVHKKITKDWGIPVSLNAVNAFRSKHFETIEARVDQYQRTYSDLRLSHKRGRLEELIWLFGQRLDIYKDTGYREDAKICMAIIEQIRKECEGEKITIDGSLEIKLDVVMAAHIKNDMLKHISLYDIIIGRVSSRMSINPIYLINCLHNSFYANTETSEDSNALIVGYPSEQPYDFNKIRRIHDQQKHNGDIQRLVQIEVHSPEAVQKSDDTREKLLALLRNKQNELSKRKDENTIIID